MSRDVYGAYVDGSYSSKTPGVVGAGFVLLDPYGRVVYEGNKYSTAEELVEMRNVGGEIMAAMLAIDKAEERGVKKLHIFHDYEGVGAWPCGTWMAKKPATQNYADVVREAWDRMEIVFEKVPAHLGIIQNERADELAKYAIERYRKAVA
jgi:ribonuclease HI